MNHKTSRIELARTLYEWSTNSKTTFNDESPELLEKIKKLGIPYPNPDLAFFTTVYCELGTYNRNNAMLPKDVAEKGLDTIKFKQINFEHEGAGHICGFILDARIVDNFIVIDGVLFKSVWKEEFDQVQKYFEQGNLCVSFEFWNSENGVSVLKLLADGKKIVEKLIAHGCGLLMKEKPACQKAKVFKLLAKEELVLASEQINEIVSTTDDKLSYAELSIKEECKNCGKCSNERRTIVMAEEIQVNKSEDIEVVELTEDIKKDEVIVAEIKLEDIKIEETIEKKEDSVETAIAEVSPVESKKMINSTVRTIRITEYDDGTKEETQELNVYVQSELDEILEEAAIPKEVLSRVKELIKDGKSMKEAMKQAWKEQKEQATEVEKAHLDTLKHCSGCGDVLLDGHEGELCAMCKLKHEKAHLQETCDQLIKENEAHKVSYAELQKKHEDTIKELQDKIDVLTKEQENAKQELGKKDQEITEMKIIKAKAETTEGKPSLTVGSVDSTSDDTLFEIRRKVDDKAFGRNSLGAK